MSHDVTRGRKHRAAYVGVLRRCARHFHLGHVAGQQPVGQDGQAQQGYDRDPNHNVAPRPGRRSSVARAARRAVDSQALQVFVFCVNRHTYEYGKCADPVSPKTTNQPRNAVRIFWRAACQAGNSPPNNPMARAKTIAYIATCHVICRLNTTSLNVTAFDVPVCIPLNGSISRSPATAPNRASNNDSKTNEVKMAGRENPNTRKVAISTPRYATAAYIVFIAAKLDPMAMMIATTMPMYLIGAPELVCFA